MLSKTQGLLCALSLCLTAAAYELVPWPSGRAPHGDELRDQVADALSRERLERFEEFLEADERGEDREHITVFQEQIDEGLYTVEALFNFGDALFEHEFSLIDGWGTGELGMSRVHQGERGGLDTFSCAACHSQGGADGAGTYLQNAFLYGDGARLSSATARNAPSLLGSGLVQSLAADISIELEELKIHVLSEAAATGESLTVPLTSKGINFGTLTASPDGEVDTSGVEGIDADLIVRPFGWKGEFSTLRDLLEDAARLHFGVQSHGLATAHQDEPRPDKLGDGEWWDPDQDAVERELEVGTITAGAVYLALLESPVIIPPFDNQLREIWARGSAIFDEVECATCHVRRLTLNRSKWIEGPRRDTGEGFEFSVFLDGEFPKSVPHVELFSDLKRHDLGDHLADQRDHPQGIHKNLFRTPALWGLADTAPYLHDGRAMTVTEAIEAHGGEAERSRALYRALSSEDQGALRVFLMSLTRAPKLRVSR